MSDFFTDLDIPSDQVGMIEGLISTRSIRRYRDEPIPEQALRTMLFAASRAPSGSNRQPFRFIVLTDGPKAEQAKALIAGAAQRMWSAKRRDDGYDRGSGADANSPKARMARTMQHYVDNLDRVPALIFPCMVRYREPTIFEGASIYPAVQNLLLAARALGYGGVISGFHGTVHEELLALLEVPEDAFITATLTMGKPEGRHGPVRRRPLNELVFEESWGQSPDWAVDPPGTRFTRAGPPKTVAD